MHHYHGYLLEVEVTAQNIQKIGHYCFMVCLNGTGVISKNVYIPAD